MEQAKRDIDDLAADNDKQANLVSQLQAELAEQVTFKSKQDGQLARLLEELSSARGETLAERRERERIQLELRMLESRLEAQASLEGALQQVRVHFDAQCQACIRAEQNVVVLKAQKEILEAQIAELKEAASTRFPLRGDGRDDGYVGTRPERTARTSGRRTRNAKDAGTPPRPDPALSSGQAARMPEQPEDSKQARLC